MLRITTSIDQQGTTLKLEGKLAQEWVLEAEKVWDSLAVQPQQGRIVVNLCGVSFVDEAGRTLLHRMHRAGAKLVGTGLVTSALIEEICGPEESPSKEWIRNLLGLIFMLVLSLLPAILGDICGYRQAPSTLIVEVPTKSNPSSSKPSNHVCEKTKLRISAGKGLSS